MEGKQLQLYVGENCNNCIDFAISGTILTNILILILISSVVVLVSK